MDIEILLDLQQFRNSSGGILSDFMEKMTFLGETNTVLVIMAVVYWCVCKELGTYLLMGWSSNRLTNGVLKVTACAYRPWIRDPRVIPYGDSMTTATGYSFPSGHTMNAATVYGGFAVRRDMPWVLRIVMWIIVVLVAFSRIYLGVHNPQDVVIGAFVGLIVMWLIYKLMQWIEHHAEKDRLVMCVGICLAVAVAVYAAIKPYPTDFDAEGKLLVDGAKMANDTFKGIGWCVSFLIGWILERRYVEFSTNVPVISKLTRAATGLLSYYAVSLILVPLIKECIPTLVGTTLTCFLQVIYVTFLFPWLFMRLERQGLPEKNL